MQTQYPFPKTYPQFSVSDIDGYCEYRIENRPRNVKDGNVTYTAFVSLQDITLVVFYIFFVFWKFQTVPIFMGIIMLLLKFLWFKCHQVLHESVIVIPMHGIQLETHRGLPGLRLFSSRRFIGLTALQDVVIHEGLRGWNVHFYLVAIKIAPSTFSLEVAYENLLPQQPVLTYIHHSIQERLFNGDRKTTLSFNQHSVRSRPQHYAKK